MILFMPFLRLVCEIVLLAVLLYAGIRELSYLGTGLIILRLGLSFLTRIRQIPDFLDVFSPRVEGVIICVLKIGLEVGIFFALREDINISMDVVILILFLMSLRNISDTWSLLEIELDES